MAMGAVGNMRALMDKMDSCMQGAKASTISMPYGDAEQMMAYAQQAHESLVGAQHMPNKAAEPQPKAAGAVYLK